MKIKRIIKIQNEECLKNHTSGLESDELTHFTKTILEKTLENFSFHSFNNESLNGVFPAGRGFSHGSN
jgi:hypothetical protein